MPLSESGNPAAREILTPSTLNRRVRDLLEGALPLVWLEGELSNLARPPSGHLYFTLKDSHAQVRCAMFRPKSTWLRFKPANGQQVLARARVGLYEPRGEYQLIVEHLEEAGEGALRREFERLKALLAAEGLFATERKRTLPTMPRRIGVLTSPSGAAIRDVLDVLARRFPLVEVDVLPVPVQGDAAPAAITAMLQAAGQTRRHDVLLLTRGGGSLEDLWAFNDEAVVRAVAASPLPVVAAIGHEIDITLAELAADLRAATPSAAAELLVPDRTALQRLLVRDRQRITTVMQRLLQSCHQQLDHRLTRLQAQRPDARLRRGREQLQVLSARLHRLHGQQHRELRLQLDNLAARLRQCHPAGALQARRRDVDGLHKRLRTATARRLEQRAQTLAQLARGLNAVSPLATLQRGYAIVRRSDNDAIVRSASEVSRGDELRALLAEGEIELQVR